MIYLGSWNAVLLKDQKEIAESINVVPLPEGRRRSTCTNGLGNVISASTDYPEEAWELAKFLGGEKAMKIQASTGVASRRWQAQPNCGSSSTLVSTPRSL